MKSNRIQFFFAVVQKHTTEILQARQELKKIFFFYFETAENRGEEKRLAARVLCRFSVYLCRKIQFKTLMSHLLLIRITWERYRKKEVSKRTKKKKKFFVAFVISQILFISSDEGICDVFENNLKSRLKLVS
jgi:hypothetical protein